MEDLEFIISQYIDGGLSPEQIAALEERLTIDAEARKLLDEYRRLDVAMNVALATPAVKWDRLADHISRAVDEQEQREEASRRRVFTIGWTGRIAIAAAIALAVGLSLYPWSSATKPGVSPSPTGTTPMAINVQGPQIETATGPGVLDVKIGPSPTVAAADNAWRYADSIVAEPSRVTIAGALPAIDDQDQPH